MKHLIINETVLALLGYIAWMLVLVLSIILVRSYLVLAGKKPPNHFRPDGTDVSPLVERMSRVHANGYEHFPIFGGLLILSLVLYKGEITNSLALYFLTLHLAQGVTHIISKSPIATYIRLTFFLSQCGIAIYWIIGFIK